MKKALFILVGACLFKPSYGQDNHYAISLNYIQGLKAFSSFNTHFRGSYSGTEAAYHIFADSSGWAKTLSVNDIELQASYLNLQNITFSGQADPGRLMGSHYSVAAGLNVLLAKWGSVQWMFSSGIGLVYAPKNFYTTNNQNFIIGSALNALLYAKTKIVVPVSSRVSLEGGAGISHTSNGGLSFPNDGFDNLSGFAGILIRFDKIVTTGRQKQFEVSDNRFEITAIIGGRSQEKTGYTKNPKTNIGYYADTALQRQTPLIYQADVLFGYTHHINSLLSMTAGTDAAYYFKTFSWNNFFKTYEGPFTTYSHFSLSLTAAANLSVGRLTFSPGLGYYVLDRFLYPHTHFYTTLGIKYFITPNVALQVRTIIDDYTGAGISVGFR